MIAQERPSRGQPPHLTLPHTQCSHRNTSRAASAAAEGAGDGRKARAAEVGAGVSGAAGPRSKAAPTAKTANGRRRGGSCGRERPPSEQQTLAQLLTTKWKSALQADPFFHTFSHVRPHHQHLMFAETHSQIGFSKGVK